MNKLFSSRLSTPALRKSVVLAGALSMIVAVSACSKTDEGTTPGQKLDSAIAKTEQAAAEAKAKTESGLEKSASAVKEATATAETSGKGMAEVAGEKFDDALIMTTIKAGLAKDPDLSAIQINVDIKGGAVTLNGSAPTEAAKEKAGTIAKGTKGVTSVDNRLVIKAG